METIVTLEELQLIELAQVIHGVSESVKDHFAFGGWHSPGSGDGCIEVGDIGCIDCGFEVAASFCEHFSALIFGCDLFEDSVSRLHINFDIGIAEFFGDDGLEQTSFGHVVCGGAGLSAGATSEVFFGRCIHVFVGEVFDFLKKVFEHLCVVHVSQSSVGFCRRSTFE